VITLKTLKKIGLFSQQGQDREKRLILLIYASSIATNIDMERLLLYLLKVMDPLVGKDYVIVYVHNNNNTSQKPPFKWLRKAYAMFNRKYKKNLKQFYVIHPTVWLKTIFKILKPFLSEKILEKVNLY